MLLVLLGLGSTAWAGKPPIAILGLEVYDNGGGIDPDTTRAAKELTAALRDRAKAGTGPFTPVQGEKELIDEKLLNNCDSEAPACMATIGNGLQAEVLMYGKIEKSTQAGQSVYKVSIKLLNVTRKQLTASTVETLPVADATGVRAQMHAKTWYAKLAGAGTGGTLVIHANIDRGTVMIDEEAKGNLASGTVTITGVPEGKRTIAVEGTREYQRYEAQVTIRAGETTTQNVTMVEMPKRLSAMQPKDTLSIEGTVAQPPHKTNVWKPVFFSTLALDAAAGGFAVYAWQKQKSAVEGVSNADSSHCGDGMVSKTYRSACNWYTAQIVGWVVVGAMSAAAIGSFYMAYLRDNSGPEVVKAASGGHRKRRELAVTPVVTPDGGGATLRFDW
ncbi:MAG TPA: PEGA domain-containing protein [Kofleriaceae bacterium]|jgi:hypothetical protein|nr:PEGA domain-containing protein [Kofleriaceae bacterium]